ncbi:MAG: hypothetical protein APR63_08870, partial [Desulfuromonas sp. SDB]
IFLIPLSLFSGWENSYGHLYWECGGNSVIQTSDGGYLVTADVHVNHPYNSEDKVYIMKLTPQGERIWGREFNGDDNERGLNTVQTFDGGYAVFGWTKSFGCGLEDLWIIKTDDQGYFLWDKTYGTSDFNDYGMYGQQTRDSGFIITGYRGYWLNFNIWLLKTNSHGDTLWTKTFGGELGSLNKGLMVEQTPDNGFIIAGYTNYNFSNTDRDDIYIIRTDEQGNLRWSTIFGICQQGEYDADHAFSIDQTADGGFVLTGTCHQTSIINQDIYVLKIDSMGCKQWEKIYGGLCWEEATSIQQCSDQGYIIAGTTQSFGHGLKDVYVIKTDSQGDSVWTRCYGGNKNELARCVIESTDGSYIVTGLTETFSQGPSSIYVIKIDQNATGVEDHYITYPVSTECQLISRSNIIQLFLNIPRGGAIDFNIFDLAGRNTGHCINGYYNQGAYQFKFNQIQPGIYFYRFIYGSYSQSGKIVHLP